MTDDVTGGCQCGAVRYRFVGPVPAAYACHCGECKKQSASAFSMSMAIALARLSISGTPATFETRAYSGAIKTAYFCALCGTRLWHGSSASPHVVTLKVGSLDDSADIAPRGHLWVSKQQAGISLDPDVPSFETQPDDVASWREGLI